MSHTETEIHAPSIIQAPKTHELKPERSQLGFIRPDHSKSVIMDWLTTVDHKKIGIMYGTIALFFLLVGGFEALIIRTASFSRKRSNHGAALQPVVYNARHDDDFPRDHASQCCFF